MFNHQQGNTYALRTRTASISTMLLATSLFVWAGHDAYADEVHQGYSLNTSQTLHSEGKNVMRNPLRQNNETHASQVELSKTPETPQKATTLKQNVTYTNNHLAQENTAPEINHSVHHTELKAPNSTPNPIDVVHAPKIASHQDNQNAGLDPGFSVIDRRNAETTPNQVDPEFNNVNAHKQEINYEKKSAHTPNLEIIDNDKKSTTTQNLSAKEETQPYEQQVAPTKEATVKKVTQAPQQAQYKNKEPIIFVHGYGGFVGNNAPPGTHYWGGKNMT